MAKRGTSKDDSAYALVFSSDKGRTCPKCEEAVEKCHCRTSGIEAGDGRVRVRREVKGRGGKTVTTLRGFALNEKELLGLGADLKKRCGSGGTVKDGVIEIQGNHVDLLLDVLSRRGFDVKRSGG